MPGSHGLKRREKRLNHRQNDIVKEILNEQFNLDKGPTQWDEKRLELVVAINEAFAAAGENQDYDLIRLNEWLNNKLYRGRAKNRSTAASVAAGAAGAASGAADVVARGAADVVARGARGARGAARSIKKKINKRGRRRRTK
jgi:hypothetical protein